MRRKLSSIGGAPNVGTSVVKHGARDVDVPMFFTPLIFKLGNLFVQTRQGVSPTCMGLDKAQSAVPGHQVPSTW